MDLLADYIFQLFQKHEFSLGTDCQRHTVRDLEDEFAKDLSEEQKSFLLKIEAERNLLTCCEEMELVKFVIVFCKDIYAGNNILTTKRLD